MNKLNNKAITLISLVITTIILLILVAVTLNLILGDNGIIEKAIVSKENTNKASKEEEERLKNLEDNLEISTNRQENSNKRKIIFDSQIDEKGPIINAGLEDGSSERAFTDNINNYDMILLYVEATADETLYPPTTIDKSDFDKEAYFYIGGYSSNVNYAGGKVKIDTQNNKIHFVYKGHNTQYIAKVIGIKL